MRCERDVQKLVVLILAAVYKSAPACALKYMYPSAVKSLSCSAGALHLLGVLKAS